MVFDRLFRILTQQPDTAQQAPAPTNTPARPQPLALPHPEEPMNPAATMANTTLSAMMNKWFADWEVPQKYWSYWMQSIDIQVHEVYPPSLLSMGIKQETPAATWEANGKRHLAIKPQWLNPGVIAHEQAHNSYALLNAEQKQAFAAQYKPLINTDPLIKLLYSKNTYGLSSDVEGHAEVYRYIGQKMPAQLKMFYPGFF